ncbi:MAG: tungstate ABC transporter substrate-binding protein WtpA [Dehalococcoidales bacterium]|nr:tungstate ABC transporter substrate-binding protein WtpA [Dehalococcoidales bacterium]
MRVKRFCSILPVIIAIIAGSGLFPSCSLENSQRVQLRVYCADSLILPFLEIEKQYERGSPEIDVIIEGHGSIQVIRAVTELGEDVDVATVADSQLIRLLMYDTPMKDKNGNYADWCIDFSTNAMGIAYTGQSRYAVEISDENWFEIMSRPDVTIGLSDPRIDSLGYRALMLMRLAEIYYEDQLLTDRMIGDGFVVGLKIEKADGLTTIIVPELLKPAQDRIVLRSYSLQVLALLESGDVDYSFEYESVARQHGFHFLPLPEAVDLSSQDYFDTYHQVRVAMEFQRFASVNPQFPGTPIVYGVTVPNNARHPQEAAAFIKYLLEKEGRTILDKHFQPSLVPAACDNITRLPDKLRSMFK